MLAVFLFLFGAAGALAQEETSVYSRIVEIEGIGQFHYYAQNDPAWLDMVYEPRKSATRRTLGQSGCGPTSLAMAIARQLPEERLPDLIAHASNPERGFPYCACSVGAYHHYGEHEVTFPTKPEDFAAALPVILASYATGNNDQWAKMRQEDVAGTSLYLFKMISDAYGLSYHVSADWEDALAALQEGCSVLTTVTKGIFTDTSHYMTLAGVADGYLYILDPLMRSEYPNDRKGRLEVVEPGVVRAKLEDVRNLWLYGFYIIGP